MASNDQLLYLVAITIGINIMLMLAQAAMIDTNPGAAVFYDCKSSFLGQFEASGCSNISNTILNNSNPIGSLPSGESSISPETGNIFTDTFTAAKTFLLTQLGLGYVLHLLSAPYTILSALALPATLVFAVGSAWYAFSFLVIVGWLFSK